MHVPFLDLKLVSQPQEEEIITAISEVVKSGWYILGNKLKAFESQFAEYCQTKHCIGVANGLDAISLILKAYDFPNDSEVIVPSNTYIATILGVINAGLTPVLVEPSFSNYLINEAEIEQHITPKTKAILIVELYGKSCNLAELKRIADKHDIKLISDSAQSHGATYHTKPTTHWLAAAAYSFYPTKNLGALGDAGAVVTNDDALAEHITYLRNYGSAIKYQFDYQGINSRLDEIQAAILSVKLPYLNQQLDKRRAFAKKYLSEIKNKNISLPPNDSIDEDAWHLFVIRCKKRDLLRSFLKNANIDTDIHYPIPPHKQKALVHLQQKSFPISELLHQEMVSIPLNHTMSNEQVTHVISTLNRFEC